MEIIHIRHSLNWKDVDLHLRFRLNFVNDIQGWTRHFTFIKFDEVRGKFYIGHRIQGKIGKLTPIEWEDINEWIKYFDRI